MAIPINIHPSALSIVALPIYFKKNSLLCATEMDTKYNNTNAPKPVAIMNANLALMVFKGVKKKPSR